MSINNINSNRITGLATGMDTDAMVKQMLSRETIRITTAKQTNQLVKWEQEAFIGVIKSLKDFEGSFLNILAPSSSNMMLSSAYSGLKATSSNSDMMDVTAANGAIKGNYKVKVNQVATGAKMEKVLGTEFSGKLVDGKEIKITTEGKDFTITVGSSMTKQDFANAMKNAKNAQGEFLSSYAEISYSEITDKLSIETKQVGAGATLAIQDLTGTVATDLGITTVEPPKNSKFQILMPGESVFSPEIERTSNTFTIDNVSFKLESSSQGNIIDFTVKADATQTIDKFKKFIEQYNSLIEKLNKSVNEKKQYTYKPLTDEQKKDMKEDEIKNWEEKAKQGLLSRDNNISNLLIQMRDAFYSKVQGAGVSLTEIGISTTSNYKDGGKLVLDEDKLKQSLETRGDDIQRLFTQNGTEQSEKGIFRNIRESLNNFVGSNGVLIKKAGYENTRYASDNELSKKVEEREKAISLMERKFFEKQDRYYKMFAALERNMNNLNSQSSWLTSQLGSG